MTLKNYLQLTPEHFFFSRSNLEINLDPAIIQISLMNIDLIQLLNQYHASSMPKNNRTKEP